MEGSPSSQVVTVNVGGTLFTSTGATLPSSLPSFLDLDPSTFSLLLTLLRTHRLPSPPTPHLIAAARRLNLLPLLRSALSPPPFLGPSASLSTTLPLSPSAFSAAPDGSALIAHAGQLSLFDWTLNNTTTVRTHLDYITSLRHVSTTTAAVGSTDSPGLHFYDVSVNSHAGAVHWSDPTDPRVYKANVSAIAGLPPSGGKLFAAFECPHRENCIMEVDVEEMRPGIMIGRQSGGAAKTAVPDKVVNVAERGMVFASAVSRGAFGYSGYMRLWDARSGKMVWEACEPGGSGRFGDSFSDADVDCKAEAIYKVCWKSGDLAVADMRMLGDDPWVYLAGVGVRRPTGGEGSVVHCYKRQVFVSKEDGLEVWSRLGGNADGREVIGSGYRRDYVDTEEDARRGMVTMMDGDGDRLFLCREGMEGVEVWESSNLSGVVSLL